MESLKQVMMSFYKLAAGSDPLKNLEWTYEQGGRMGSKGQRDTWTCSVALRDGQMVRGAPKRDKKAAQKDCVEAAVSFFHRLQMRALGGNSDLDGGDRGGATAPLSDVVGRGRQIETPVSVQRFSHEAKSIAGLGAKRSLDTDASSSIAAKRPLQEFLPPVASDFMNPMESLRQVLRSVYKLPHCPDPLKNLGWTYEQGCCEGSKGKRDTWTCSVVLPEGHQIKSAEKRDKRSAQKDCASKAASFLTMESKQR